MAKILVVDDDQTTRVVIGDMIAERVPGVWLRYAADGPETLEYVNDDPPSLVVLNIMMPGKTGIEVLAEMRAAGQEVPVVLTSGYVRREELLERKVLDDPRVRFLRKPFRVDDLIRTVEELISL